ncbi:hypothetical protein AVEN_232379-1 [Araneus ventricosus]|uniref:Uncharacterized protein n=1 Tax=Araneus ventricosus TaxID=182803 RepID=A0A4Y2CW38_ARAVE|nr:hypothetical protein AVEN_232379-1 [Araneus ventricosus]
MRFSGTRSLLGLAQCNNCRWDPKDGEDLSSLQKPKRLPICTIIITTIEPKPTINVLFVALNKTTQILVAATRPLCQSRLPVTLWGASRMCVKSLPAAEVYLGRLCVHFYGSSSFTAAFKSQI